MDICFYAFGDMDWTGFGFVSSCFLFLNKYLILNLLNMWIKENNVVLAYVIVDSVQSKIRLQENIIELVAFIT